jgi:FMN phosphatase YigB (HAD superfamily)
MMEFMDEERMPRCHMAVCSKAPTASVSSSFSDDLSVGADPNWDDRAAGFEQSVRTLSAQVAERDRTIQMLETKLAERGQATSAQLAAREKAIEALSAQLAEMSNCKAWRAVLTLRRVFFSLVPPGSFRDKALRRLARTAIATSRRIRGIPVRNSKQAWASSVKRKEGLTPASLFLPQGAKSPNLVKIEDIVPCEASPGRIGVHIHVFHPELAAEFAGCLLNLPFPYDLFISTPDKDARQVCERVFSGLPMCEKVKIEVVPNRGRDIAPMFCAFGEDLATYDFIAHLHTKKSGENNTADLSWREYLCANLFGSEKRIRRIFTLLSGETPAGIVYPQTYGVMPSWAHTWLGNRHLGAEWSKRLGIDRIPRGYFDYPVGSMFWARTDALRPLFAAGLRLGDFPVEAGQLDGTLAHCLERMLVLVARHQGFGDAVIEDTKTRSWSAWRLDRYFTRTQKSFENSFGYRKIRVVAFDIFDTLLSRPLLDPETTKEIVAQRAAESLGELYRQCRSRAEAVARRNAGRDVGLDAIYAEFIKQSGVSREDADSLRRLEEDVEWHSVSPRADGVALLRLAREAGKRVVLISDMFLPKKFIESLLKEHGIVDWDTLYLSNDVGMRKDTGALYRHVLDREKITASQMLMVGDGERSDAQVPVTLKMPTHHLLRPVETARGLPRLNPFVEELEQDKDLNKQLTLGLLLQQAFSPIFHKNFSPADLFVPTASGLGYGVVGPLILGFARWLAEQANRDGIDRLYFLAREGEKLKFVYDRWNAAFGEGPPSEYLVLSRRATTVPAVESREDILNIARPPYAANDARSFLDERFGLTLSEKRWDEIRRQSGWGPKRQVTVIGDEIGADVQQLLDAVEGDILAQSAAERPTLKAYLRQIGLERAERAAIVDIGYSATVQDRVSLFLGKPIHGYYMMTIAPAHAVADRHGSIVRGCFVEGARDCRTAAPIYQNSFTLEKLLGSNDAQVVRYEPQGDGRLAGVFRPLSKAEQKGNQARDEIKAGMLQYADDVIKLRKNLFPAFCPPLKLAEEIFMAFIANLSRSEKAVLQTLILDDFYCGRGLV